MTFGGGGSENEVRPRTMTRIGPAVIVGFIIAVLVAVLFSVDIVPIDNERELRVLMQQDTIVDFVGEDSCVLVGEVTFTNNEETSLYLYYRYGS